jgi:hypothetical protein
LNSFEGDVHYKYKQNFKKLKILVRHFIEFAENEGDYFCQPVITIRWLAEKQSLSYARRYCLLMVLRRDCFPEAGSGQAVPRNDAHGDSCSPRIVTK